MPKSKEESTVALSYCDIAKNCLKKQEAAEVVKTTGTDRPSSGVRDQVLIEARIPCVQQNSPDSDRKQWVQKRVGPLPISRSREGTTLPFSYSDVAKKCLKKQEAPEVVKSEGGAHQSGVLTTTVGNPTVHESLFCQDQTKAASRRDDVNVKRSTKRRSQVKPAR